MIMTQIVLLAILSTAFAGPVLMPDASASSNDFDVPLHQKGMGEPRVVGGQVAAPHSFPYQVLLVYYPYTSYCGGSLVDNQWVLTAAHCIDLVKEYPMQVVLGVFNISNMDGSELNLTSSEFYIHPEWNRQNISNDIALIKLPSRVEYRENIQPISLPARSQVNENLTNEEVTVSGWGWATQSAMQPSQVLRYVELTVMSNEECSKIFHKVRDTNLCTSGSGGKNPCYGDSGGPLVLTEAAAGGRTQVGVVLYGSNWGCEMGRPAAYTRTSSYLDWIAATAGLAVRQ